MKTTDRILIAIAIVVGVCYTVAVTIQILHNFGIYKMK